MCGFLNILLNVAPQQTVVGYQQMRDDTYLNCVCTLYTDVYTLQLVVPDLGAADGASGLLRRGAHLARVRVRG